MISDAKESDLEYARKTYRDMLEKSNEAVEIMMNLLGESESPRVGEVTANLIKSTADIADKLVSLHKSNKEIEAKAIGEDKNLLSGGGIKNANQFNFYGTTAQIQEMMKKINNSEELPIQTNSISKEE